ncbi:Arginine N-methyltransferase 2 [Ascosphaera pollenicola]|nr:Arginine N-methyltransferase 2 [Ascosphaera pollenicola]
MASQEQDKLDAIDIDVVTQEILLAASEHDVPKLRRLVRQHDRQGNNAANVKDSETGYTPLHAAIAACEPEDATEANGVAEPGQNQVSPETLEKARATVEWLLQDGAIWNDLDANGETPGCLARRLGLKEIYEMMVDAGVRAELLLNRLDGYEELQEEVSDTEDAEGMQVDSETKEQESGGDETEAPQLVSAETTTQSQQDDTTEVNQETYLHSNLTLQNDRLLDDDKNGVMMAWETDIMRKSAQALLPTPGLRVLNIGHGMGIIDGIFQDQKPSAHHIVEAHPDVLANMKAKGWTEKPGVTIHEGRWQDVLPKLVEQGETFDAIYYDTFAESYEDFKEFFTEHVISLLDSNGKWGFFNGMGADRQISYDVYQKVVEIDLLESGFDIDWENIKVPDLEDEWAGVRRKYWVVDNYRLPLCRYMD